MEAECKGRGRAGVYTRRAERPIAVNARAVAGTRAGDRQGRYEGHAARARLKLGASAIAHGLVRCDTRLLDLVRSAARVRPRAPAIVDGRRARVRARARRIEDAALHTDRFGEAPNEEADRHWHVGCALVQREELAHLRAIDHEAP